MNFKMINFMLSFIICNFLHKNKVSGEKNKMTCGKMEIKNII